MGIFGYARRKLYVNKLLDGAGDVVNRRALKPLHRVKPRNIGRIEGLKACDDPRLY
jgi:hypothetical protein